MRIYLTDYFYVLFHAIYGIQLNKYIESILHFSMSNNIHII